MILCVFFYVHQVNFLKSAANATNKQPIFHCVFILSFDCCFCLHWLFWVELVIVIDNKRTAKQTSIDRVGDLLNVIRGTNTLTCVMQQTIDYTTKISIIKMYVEKELCATELKIAVNSFYFVCVCWNSSLKPKVAIVECVKNFSLETSIVVVVFSSLNFWVMRRFFDNCIFCGYFDCNARFMVTA